jgi:hypothetical protein
MVRAMKTTLDIDEELLNQAKSLSVREVYRGKSGLAMGIDPTTLR